MTRLYVAGPMTGLPEYNYPAFHQAAQELRAAGYEVENPAENPACDTWDDYVRAGLRQVLAVDGIATLWDWQTSRGAALEVHVAHALRLTVLPIAAWIARAGVL